MTYLAAIVLKPFLIAGFLVCLYLVRRVCEKLPPGRVRRLLLLKVD